MIMTAANEFAACYKKRAQGRVPIWARNTFATLSTRFNGFSVADAELIRRAFLSKQVFRSSLAYPLYKTVQTEVIRLAFNSKIIFSYLVYKRVGKATKLIPSNTRQIIR